MNSTFSHQLKSAITQIYHSHSYNLLYSFANMCLTVSLAF